MAHTYDGVTPAEIRQIYSYDASISDEDVSIMIYSARILVDNITGLHEYTLKEIERWLGAHFVAIRDPQRSIEKIGSVQESYQYQVGLNLNQTRYGQMAIILDTTGYLAGLQAKATAASKGTAAVTVASLSVMGPVASEDM